MAVNCPSCATQLIPGKAFCHACGTPARKSCAACGTSLDPHFRFCPDCGAPVDPAELHAIEAPAPPPASVPEAPRQDERFEQLRAHIPDDLARKIRQTGSVSGERKRVTVLFCDLVGSTAIAERSDPEVYRELLDRYLESAFREIYRFEGIVNQLAGDGFMALFGAPIAHEDDAERAVRAALAIQAALGELNPRLQSEHGFALRIRIGIHTGTVVAGTVGNDLKMDYTAIGDTTNLAARLQSLAEPGAIVVSEATHRLVREDVRSRPVGPFEIKGRSEPVQAHEIVRLATPLTAMSIAGSEGLTQLVGRDAELAQLDACYERALGGLSQVVSIVGEAGMGKSRLVYEFKQKLPKRVTLFEARCSSLTRGVPYAPWIGMLQRYFGVQPDEPFEEACSRVAGRCGDDEPGADSIAPYLCALVCQAGRGEGGSDRADSTLEERKRRAFAAVEELVIRAARRGPVVMIIEDLHWIDDASREILELAASRFCSDPEMLIVTHRPEYVPEWKTHAALTQLYLGRLDDPQAAEIVRVRAGGALPVELEQRILRRGEGNPLFLEELTRALDDEGLLVRRNGEVELTRPVDEVRIPDTLQELLGARLDRLSPEAKRTAQVAAVLGRQFRREQLVPLLADEGVDVRTALAELERVGVIHRNLDLERDEFRFGESMTQEAAYEGLLLRERRQLHRRVGEQLEASGDAHLPVLAHHFARSDAPRKGLELLLQAAKEAEDLPSYGDAVRLYQEAWERCEAQLAEPGGDARELERSAVAAIRGLLGAAVVHGSTEIDLLDHAARRGIELAERLGDRVGLARLHANRGLLLMNGERELFADGLLLVEQAVREVRAAELPNEVAVLERQLSWGYLLDGRFEEAHKTIAGALAQLEQAGGRGSNAYLGGRFFQLRVLLESDALTETERASLETYELARASGNRTVESGAASMLCALFFLRGDYSEAERWGKTASEVAERIGTIAFARSLAVVQLAVRLERGERPRDAAELERVYRGLASAGTRDIGINVDSMVETLIDAGAIELAHRIAHANSLNAGGRLREARSALCMGLVHQALGEEHLATAERHLVDALASSREIGARSLGARSLLALAHQPVPAGAPDLALERAEAARVIFSDLQMGRYEARALQILRPSRLEPTVRA